MSGKLLFVVNDLGFFISHRLPVAKAAYAHGYEVHIGTTSGEAVSDILQYGFHFHELPFSRSGRFFLSEAKTFFLVWRLCWHVRPDILHLVTIKPVIYGGIAARFAPVRGVVAAISGLGFVFMAKGIKAFVLRRVVGRLYRLALKKENLKVIFQNPDDFRVMKKIGAVEAKNVVMIKGSGVDLSIYKFSPEREGIPVVTFAARLLRDKGVVEFIEAVRLLRQRGVVARFQLVGELDSGNPTSITPEELEDWRSSGIVELLGYRRDMAQIFSECHVVVLPSYREGLPKVLMEAAACGRAVITTDVPGCRDAIENDVTGLLVPVCNIEALADAIEKLIENPMLRLRLGQAGRELAERDFGIEGIVKQHLDIYQSLRCAA